MASSIPVLCLHQGKEDEVIRHNITINSKGLGSRGFEGQQPHKTMPPRRFRSLQIQKAWPSLPKEKEPEDEEIRMGTGQGMEGREEPFPLSKPWVCFIH